MVTTSGMPCWSKLPTACWPTSASATRLRAWGGDEFVVLLAELDGNATRAEQIAWQIAEKLLRVLAESYRLRPNADRTIEYDLSASIGISLFLDDEDNAEKILKQADIAMYQAKKQGRGVIRSYEQDILSVVE